MKDEWIEEAGWNVEVKMVLNEVDCSVHVLPAEKIYRLFSIPVIPDNEYYVSLEDTENLDLEKK